MSHSVSVVKWDMLVMLKLYAGGPQDMLDVQQILKVRHPSTAELQMVGNLAGTFGLLEEWTILSADFIKNH